MSTIPLKQDMTDFQACQLFQNFKQQLRDIAKQSNLNKNIARTVKKIQKLKQTPTSSIKTQQIDRMLYNNIIVDYLKSTNNNYTYPVFMRECNIISEEVISKKQLAILLNLQQQYEKQQRFDVSIVELMIQKLRKYQEKKKKYVDEEVQVQIFKRDGKENNILIMENRIREIREEVQQRERKYYEKMLESMRSKEILQLRDQISKQMQQKMKNQVHKNDKKMQQLIQKARNNENSSKLKQQNENLINKNYELSKQLSSIKSQLSLLQKQKQSHSCRKSPQFLSLKQSLAQQKQQLKQKNSHLDYALRNLNTKVQQLVQRKSKIQGQKKSDRFVQQIRTNKINKDHMIEVINTEMRQMEKRVKLLAEDNQTLRGNVKELKAKIKEKQEFYGKLSEQLLQKQHSVNTLQQQSRIREGIHSQSISAINKKPQNSNEHIIPQKFMPSYRPNSTVANNPQSQKATKCLQCLRRKSASLSKPKLINICVGVNQQQLQKTYVNQENNDNSDDQNRQNNGNSYSDQEDDQDFDQFQNKTLEHNKKLAKIRADMNIIKKKVLLLVDQNGLY